MRRFLASALEVAEVIVIALGAVLVIRSFLVQPFLVSGASMVPNFSNGDYLLIDELSHRFRSPQRGEVVVFRYPRDPGTYFIKRIVGLPGETVALKNGEVTILSEANPEGGALEEPYLASGTATNPRPNGKSEFVLGPDEYLVLGDNRAYSFDSRDWGVLLGEDIVGVARLRLWPPTSLTVFAAPQY